jgi:2-keto-3-deoxy-L-rhamnonate aldolase RhmA
MKAMRQIIEAALAAGKIAGIYAPSLETAKPWMDLGVRFIETADEVSFIRAGSSFLCNQLRSAAK